MSQPRRAKRALARQQKEETIAKRLKETDPINDITKTDLVTSVKQAMHNQDCPDVNQAMSNLAHVDSQARKLRFTSLASTLKNHDATFNDELQALFQEHFPDIHRLAGGTLRVVPAATLVTSLASDPLSFGKDLLQHLRAHPRRHHQLLEELRSVWAARHSLVDKPATPLPDQEAAGPKESECCKLGVCVCRARGRQAIKSMRVSWGIQALGRQCKAASVGRLLLNSGMLICRVESYEAIEDNDMDEDACSMFFHASMMYWSPVRPTFVELECVAEDHDSGLVTLRSTSSILTDYQLFERLDKQRVWETSWYELESSCRPVMRLVPGVVVAKPWKLVVDHPLRFWPRQRTRHAANRRLLQSGDAEDAEVPEQAPPPSSN